MSIALMILTCALIVPVGTSYAAYDDSPAFNPSLKSTDNQTNSNMTISATGNQTNSNMTMPQTSTAGSTGSTGNQTNSNMTMPQTSTASSTGKTGSTGSQTIANQTSMANDTKAAQKISDFVHQAVVHFKQQKSETRTAMLGCRDEIQTSTPSDIDKIRAGCTTQLSAIKVKYQDERSQLHDLISQYRQSVMVFLNDARGVKISKTDMDKAFSELITMMHVEAASSGMTGPITGLMAKTNNTNCVNPPGGPAIC